MFERLGTKVLFFFFFSKPVDLPVFPRGTFKRNPRGSELLLTSSAV